MKTLNEFKKGYHIINIIASSLMLGLCTTCIILRTDLMWMALALAFATLYNLFNSFILYNARKVYESEN